MITTKYLKLNAEDIKKSINPLQIYSFYLNKEVRYEEVFCSPLREDRKPSFIVLGSGYYYDFGTKETGDCITFVMRYLNISFSQAMKRIITDFSVLEKTKFETLKQVNTKTTIIPWYRDWNKGDKEFWNSFHISKNTLTKLNVNPISYYEINNFKFRVKKLAYCYVTGSRFKIYQPFDDNYRYFGNTNENSIFGYDIMDLTSDTLYIVSSLKEVAIMLELGYNAIAPNSESSMFKLNIMDYLKSIYDNIIVLFDWDAEGITLSNKFCEHYGGLQQKIINAAEKDLSDYSRTFGLAAVNTLINEKN